VLLPLLVILVVLDAKEGQPKIVVKDQEENQQALLLHLSAHTPSAMKKPEVIRMPY
jgi:hypothetical protein